MKLLDLLNMVAIETDVAIKNEKCLCYVRNARRLCHPEYLDKTVKTVYVSGELELTVILKEE